MKEMLNFHVNPEGNLDVIFAPPYRPISTYCIPDRVLNPNIMSCHLASPLEERKGPGVAKSLTMLGPRVPLSTALLLCVLPEGTHTLPCTPAGVCRVQEGMFTGSPERSRCGTAGCFSHCANRSWAQWHWRASAWGHGTGSCRRFSKRETILWASSLLSSQASSVRFLIQGLIV